MRKLKSVGYWLFVDTLVYKCALIVMAFLYIFPFTAAQTQRFSKVFLLWGAAILALDLVTKRLCLQRKEYLPFYGLIALTGVSALVHFDNQLSRNLIFTLYLAAFAGVPLLVDRNKPRSRIYRELKVLSVLLSAIPFCVNLVALGIFAVDYHGSVTVNGVEYLLGFVNGRLYGPVGNPNTTAHMALLSMVFSGIALVFFSKKWVRGLFIANIGVQFVAMSLGNSRSAVVGLCAMAAMGLFFYFKGHRVKFSKKAATVALSAVLAVVVGVGGVFAATKLSNRVMGLVPPIYHMLCNPVQDPGTQQPGTDATRPSKPGFEITDTDRFHTSDDISNGRLTIWLAGLAVARENLLFGVGSENILAAANEKLPPAMLEKTPEIAANMHNVYLQILVGNGLPALLCFVVFMGWILLKGLKKILSATDVEKKISVLLLCGVGGMLVENLFDSNVIGFMCLFIVPVFWTMCGYLMKMTEGVQEIEENSVSH